MREFQGSIARILPGCIFLLFEYSTTTTTTMTQYRKTDDSIFALGAAAKGSIITSKVPKHGADTIRISRLSKDGKLVLKDQNGEALLSAFGDSTYRWDGTTPLTNVIQKYSFANRGFVSGQTDTGVI